MTPPSKSPTLIPTEHSVALADQARAIRLAAQRLERAAREHPPGTIGQQNQLRRIQLDLGNIRANLDALFARFGKADR